MFRFTALLLIVALAGCHHGQEPTPPMDYSAELPPGTLALRKIPRDQYPDFSGAFSNANVPQVLKAIDQSLKYLEAPSSQHYYPYGDISHDRAVASLKELKKLLSGPPLMSVNDSIAYEFDVYQSVGAPRPDGSGYSGEILFTGYYTPIYPASLTRTDTFKWPLYKRPANLLTDDEGKKAWVKQPGGTQATYPYDRKQIEQNHLLDGQELVWLNNRWDAYVISVQGSARLKLSDGRIYEIGYAGNNGMDYVSPGKQMIADGTIPKSQLSLRGLRSYFDLHPEMMDRYLWINPRFVFFTERPGGPFGSLNVPVTPMASIATDKDVYPRAMPAFVVTTIPSPMTHGTEAFRAFMLDQDAGGAIRAAGRCDLYMGIGPAAEGLAGEQMYPGELYYVAVKEGLTPGNSTPPSRPAEP